MGFPFKIPFLNDQRLAAFGIRNDGGLREVLSAVVFGNRKSVSLQEGLSAYRLWKLQGREFAEKLLIISAV